MTTRNTRFRNIALALVSFISAGIAAEFAWRYMEPQQLKERVHDNKQPFVMYDEKLGWKNRPGAQGPFVLPWSETQVQINQLGMRDRERGPKQGIRVAVLGDSMVWGYGMKPQNRFTNLLEDMTGVEVLNFGVVGYSPLQQYLALNHVMAQDPDLVVLGFTLNNDFYDNVISKMHEFYRPYAAYEGGALKILGQPVPDYRRYSDRDYPFYTRYALGRLIYFGLLDKGVLPEIKGAPPVQGYTGIRRNDLYLPSDTPGLAPVFSVNHAILKLIRNRLHERDIPLLVLAIPSNHAIENLQKALGNQTRSLRVAMVTVQGFQKGNKFVLPDQLHPSVAGHRLIAESLAPYIQGFKASKQSKAAVP